MIVRFFSQEGLPAQIRKRDLTLEQAQKHCSDPNTRKEGKWFDGYTEDNKF